MYMNEGKREEKNAKRRPAKRVRATLRVKPRRSSTLGVGMIVDSHDARSATTIGKE